MYKSGDFLGNSTIRTAETARQVFNTLTYNLTKIVSYVLITTYDVGRRGYNEWIANSSNDSSIEVHFVKKQGENGLTNLRQVRPA